ncbi:MAG: hypothetical protein IPL06_01945 [Betaproteobacteria bacterium]|nr:hypothetical protein [Betaproteobacteria bacterium]
MARSKRSGEFAESLKGFGNDKETRDMSGFRILMLGVAGFIPGLVGAVSPLDGSWDVTFSTRDGETRQAVVEIAGVQGTWTSIAQSGKERRDPCVGRPFPLAVASTDPARIVLEVAFAKSVAGCRDRTVTGRLDGAGTVEGKLENGKPLRMTRRSAGT